MIDLRFIEIGAVVTEILGPSRCTIEPFCDPARPPTYDPERRVEVDFELLLDNVLGSRNFLLAIELAAERALYDQIPNHRSPPIGPTWPGGGYEGIVTIREDIVRDNPILAAAVAALPGHPWEYQVIASIDEETGKVARRFHGFHADVVDESGDAVVLRVADAGRSGDPQSPRKTVRYTPGAAAFYRGALVAETAVRGGKAPRRSGALFVSIDSLVSDGGSLPKLPAGLGE